MSEKTKLPTPVATITNPKELAKSYIATILTAIAFQNEQPEVKGQFFAAPEGNAPANDADKRAETQFNDPTSGVYLSTNFQNTILAMTGFKPRSFTSVHNLEWRVGMVVTPATPAYRERTDDGYEAGKLYLVTNQTHGFGRTLNDDASSAKNSRKPMSRLNDEWTLVTDADVIKGLVENLVETRGINFVEDVLTDNGSGKSLRPIVERYFA